MPKKYGRGEPFEHDLSTGDVDRFCEMWAAGKWMNWEDKGINCEGGYADSRHWHSRLHHMLDDNVGDSENCCEFLRQLAMGYGVDHAHIHTYADAETELDRQFKNITFHQIKHGLPGIPWAVCYGKPYVDMFGKERLLSLEVHKTEEIKEDLVYCQMTESITDVRAHNTEFNSVREGAMEHLGRQFFLSESESGSQCTVPQFHFPRSNK